MSPINKKSMLAIAVGAILLLHHQINCADQKFEDERIFNLATSRVLHNDYSECGTSQLNSFQIAFCELATIVDDNLRQQALSRVLFSSVVYLATCRDSLDEIFQDSIETSTTRKDKFWIDKVASLGLSSADFNIRKNKNLLEFLSTTLKDNQQRKAKIEDLIKILPIKSKVPIFGGLCSAFEDPFMPAKGISIHPMTAQCILLKFGLAENILSREFVDRSPVLSKLDKVGNLCEHLKSFVKDLN